MVARRRLRKIGGVGFTTPNPSGRFGSTRVPSHAGRRVTQRFGGAEEGEAGAAGAEAGGATADGDDTAGFRLSEPVVARPAVHAVRPTTATRLQHASRGGVVIWKGALLVRGLVGAGVCFRARIRERSQYLL